MDLICTTKQAARLLNCSQRNVERRARAGGDRFYCKHGERYLINMTREFPGMFGAENRSARADGTRAGR